MIQDKELDSSVQRKSRSGGRKARRTALSGKGDLDLDVSNKIGATNKNDIRKTKSDREKRTSQGSNHPNAARTKSCPEKPAETAKRNSNNIQSVGPKTRSPKHARAASIPPPGDNSPKQRNSAAPESPQKKKSRVEKTPADKLLGAAFNMLNIRKIFPRNEPRDTKTTRSRKSGGKGRRKSPPVSEMNIICCPGMVRTQFILDNLEEVKGQT